MNRFRPAIAVGFALLCGACGYRVSGHADALPKNIKTIAIPAFGNATTLYRLTERLPADIAREFISRTRYAVVTDPNKADAVMSGSVIKVYSGAATLDPVRAHGSRHDAARSADSPPGREPPCGAQRPAGAEVSS